MQPETILTQDELDFILGMQRNPQLNVRDSTRNLVVNGGIQIQDLLARLAASEQVTIQARFNNQKISFPLQMVEDEFHAQRLQVGTPSIYEEGPQIRPWRLVLPTPIPLETDEGVLTALWVHEVSFKGVLIEYRRKGNPPRHFSAWFNPAGHPPIAMRGRLERMTEKGMAAYHLSEKYPEDSERLRQYMLGEHRRLHPAVHTLVG